MCSKKIFNIQLIMSQKLYIKQLFMSQPEDSFMKRAEIFRCYDCLIVS